MAKIVINGDVSRSFVFPADLDTAFAYYGELESIFPWLVHISKTKRYSAEQYRMMYHTVELGVYRVRIFCDLQTERDVARKVLYVKPLEGLPPVEPQTSVQALTAQGYYSSESVFHDEGLQTRIDYHLRLQAELPVPLTARLLIPGGMLHRIAQAITERRIDEIADGFIAKSVAAYRANGRAGSKPLN